MINCEWSIENLPYDCNTIVTVFDEEVARVLIKKGFIALGSTVDNFSEFPRTAKYWELYKPGHDLTFDRYGMDKLTEEVKLAVQETANLNQTDPGKSAAHP